MLYIRELCDIKNSEEGKVLSSVLYHGILFYGSRGSNPYINYYYFKYNGTHEEFSKAEKELHQFIEKKISLINKLIDKLESSKGELKEVSETLFLNGLPIPISVKKN